MAIQTAVSEVLTKVGLKYVQDPESFRAGKIFPMCPVNLLSSKYPTYDKSYWMKNEAKVRKPGTESIGGIHARGEAAYTCEDISYHEDVPMEYVQNDPDPLNPEKAATRRVTSKIAIYDEVDFVSNFFVTGKWGANEDTPSTLWDAANSTPLSDIDTYKRAIQIGTGFKANKIVMSRPVFDVLKRHITITDQVKYTSSGNVTKDILAGILEVDTIEILEAVYDSAKYGATAAQAFIGGKNLLLMHVAESPSLEEPSAGYNFVWRGYGTDGYGVRRIPLEKEMAVRVEAHHYHDMKQMATDLGYMVLAPIS
jgi:predicted aspartyl protease